MLHICCYNRQPFSLGFKGSISITSKEIKEIEVDVGIFIFLKPK
jgi:hypothetical protein